MHVLRIKCEPLDQGDILRKPGNPIEIISKSILAKPTANVGRGSEWHIGNTDFVEETGVAFAMGRTTAVTTPRFDSESHDFLEEEVMRAPYTIGVFDTDSQACGIVKKSGVSQNAKEIAGKLEILLNSSKVASEYNMAITVDPVWDPQSFLGSIREASEIIKFAFTASRPNPADVNNLIQRPAEEFNLRVGGDKTKVEVEGENLDKETIEELTKAVAAVGEDASASIREEPNSKPVRRHLAGNSVTEPVEADSHSSLLKSVLAATSKAYHRVREKI